MKELCLQWRNSCCNRGKRWCCSWSDRVLDTDATDAAAKLYEALATGNTVTEALSLAYRSLLKKKQMLTPGKRCDWHLLRLYIGQILPGALVRQGRKPPLRRSVVSQDFVDTIPSGFLSTCTK